MSMRLSKPARAETEETSSTPNYPANSTNTCQVNSRFTHKTYVNMGRSLWNLIRRDVTMLADGIFNLVKQI